VRNNGLSVVRILPTLFVAAKRSQSASHLAIVRGKRKRVNVGVELLNRPLLLFLDEPTSGLDPFSEFKMMELLRELADTGCSVVCTTHVVGNVFLMDQIAVMTKGHIVFQEPHDSVLATLGVDRFSELYGEFQSMDPKNEPFSTPPPLLKPEETEESKGSPGKRQFSFSLPILMQRQTALFRADLKNIIIALVQPLLIGGVVIWHRSPYSTAMGGIGGRS
jgi:ABC-type multidrug transport system ATPase subunit